MIQKKRLIILILLVIGALYFFAFWFPNATGAKDQNMISIFNADEFAQYPNAVHMLKAGDTWSQSVHNFFAYQHYYYGFPFYFYSVVIALLPAKIIPGIASVSWSLLLLRQMVSVLPMIAALLLLVYLQTNFDSYLKSILLFLLLLSVPEVVANDMWWHPESLVFLFIVLTFFFLVRDGLSVQKNFYIAAFFCGLAVGIKLVGLFFFLTVPAYLLISWCRKQIDARKGMIAALFFVAILVATFALSNPFLYWASERQKALNIQINQSKAMSVGFVVAYHSQPLSWIPVITQQYGSLAFVLLSLIALLLAVMAKPKRLLNLLIAAWTVPFTLYLFLEIVIRPKHFFLPIALPVFSALPAYFEYFAVPSFVRPLGAWLRKNTVHLILLLIGFIIIGAQLYSNLQSDWNNYVDTLNRETTSPSLQFYDTFNQKYLSRLPTDTRFVIYRDVTVYVPNAVNDMVYYQWGVSGYGYINKIHADVLLLSKQHLRDYTQAGQLQTAVDPNFSDAYHFYKDALDEQVHGYTLIYQDDFGMAYVSTSLYNQFFQNADLENVLCQMIRQQSSSMPSAHRLDRWAALSPPFARTIWRHSL